MAAKVCLCPGYQGQAVVCPNCHLPTAGAVKIEAKDTKEAKAAPAVAAAAAAAAPAAAAPVPAAGAYAGDGDVQMAMTPVTLTEEQRVQAAAAAAVRVNPQAFGRVVTTVANSAEAVAAWRATIAEQRRLLQWQEDVLESVEQLQNLVKRVYYRGVRSDEELVLVPVMRTPNGLVHILPQNVTVQHVIACEYLLVYAVSVDPLTSRAADGSTGAGWTCVDDVKIEMAANTDRPTVPVGLRFVLGGQYHLRYGGLSLELCRNLHRTVAMTVAKPEPAAGAAAAGAVVVAMD